MQDERASMADQIGVRFENFYGMTGARQCIDYFTVDARFHLERGACLTPGPAQQPARGRDRLLQVLTEHRVTREDRRLRLRLAVATHAAVDHGAAVAQSRARRVEGMDRLTAGNEREM